MKGRQVFELNGSKCEVPVSILTLWGRVLLDKVIVAQLVIKFPTSYGILWFIAVFTRVRHWTLS